MFFLKEADYQGMGGMGMGGMGMGGMGMGGMGMMNPIMMGMGGMGGMGMGMGGMVSPPLLSPSSYPLSQPHVLRSIQTTSISSSSSLSPISPTLSTTLHAATPSLVHSQYQSHFRRM